MCLESEGRKTGELGERRGPGEVPSKSDIASF